MMMRSEAASQRLRVLPGEYSILKFAPDADIQIPRNPGEFISITRTASELSIVAPAGQIAESPMDRSDGWRILRIEGPLDLSATGVLLSVLAPLASAQISTFVLATFDTDYALVRNGHFAAAQSALESAGHMIMSSES
jgi:hypothetical protein